MTRSSVVFLMLMMLCAFRGVAWADGAAVASPAGPRLPPALAAPAPPSAPAALVAPPPAPKPAARVPLGSRWWFWAGLGAAAAVAIAAAILVTPRDAYSGNSNPGTVTVF
jgi:hypothetical protein